MKIHKSAIKNVYYGIKIRHAYTGFNKPGVLKTAAKDSLPNTYLIRFT